ncbi:hypothetical protein SBV1_1250003 [Verrucomicrobia bacterium]|nr:hypothetical protein SBV1_1250003 [Verrucomicrobiota bacterium]
MRRSSGILILQLPEVILSDQVRRQGVAAVVGVGKEDGGTALALAWEQKEEAVLVGGEGAKQVQFEVVGEDQLEITEDEQSLAGKVRADELLKGGADVGSGWFGPFGFVIDQLAEFVVGDGVENAAVDRDRLGQGCAVGGLGFDELVRECVKQAIAAEDAIEVTAAGHREARAQGFYDFGVGHGVLAPRARWLTSPARSNLRVN